jgi:hypothetical protein
MLTAALVPRATIVAQGRTYRLKSMELYLIPVVFAHFAEFVALERHSRTGSSLW